MYRFEELDEKTRRWMMEEFEWEERTHPHRDLGLSGQGRQEYGVAMRQAIKEGDEESLARLLDRPELWEPFEPSPQGGVRKVIVSKSSLSLARNEFNIWYVRGLARRLMEEGEEYCQVYKAADLPEPKADCTMYENKVFRLRFIYNGHGARREGREGSFSIPFGKECHHSIRRLPSELKALISLDESRYQSFV